MNWVFISQKTAFFMVTAVRASSLHSHRRENLKSYIMSAYFLLEPSCNKGRSCTRSCFIDFLKGAVRRMRCANIVIVIAFASSSMNAVVSCASNRPVYFLGSPQSEGPYADIAAGKSLSNLTVEASRLRPHLLLITITNYSPYKNGRTGVSQKFAKSYDQYEANVCYHTAGY
jgi:hypothetical protein